MDMNRFNDRNALKHFYADKGIDGIELMLCGNQSISEKITCSDVIGIHLSFFPSWLDFWIGNRKALNREYGEEKYATSIAKQIIKYRENKPIETTLELVDIIKSGMPYKAMRDSHPARKVFQAIRIEVNDELNVLERALEDAISLLNVNGRICVITFHSLEDRIVKNIFRKYSEVPNEIKKLPFVPKEYQPVLKIISKGTVPSKKELEENNRARSSRLRIAEKIKE